MKIFKYILLKTFYYTGINNFARRLLRSYPRIIMLHQIRDSQNDAECITVKDFEQLVCYVKKHYHPMTSCELINYKKKFGDYPINACVITFDDGFKSFYDLAWPILKKHELPVSVFVCPGLIDSDSWIWPDCFSYVYQNGYRICTDKSLNQLLGELKKMTSADRADFIAEASRLSKVPIPENVPDEYKLMTWDMLKELSMSPLVEIGAHTLTHPILAMEDAVSSWQEISGSKQRLEEVLGTIVQSFCYPNGHTDDYLPEHLSMLRKSNYQCGLASHYGFITADSDTMALPRISPGATLLATYKYLDGVEHLKRKLFLMNHKSDNA